MPLNLKTYLGLAAFLLLLTSCGEKPYHEEYIKLDQKGWYADSLARFTVEIDDTLSAYKVILNFRGNNDYPYSNLYLFRSIQSDLGLEYSDTANFILADPYGRWLGEGLGELKSFERMYRRRPLRFNKTGIYTFELKQAMRDEPLIGLEDIGISIYKVADGEKED